MRRRFVNFAFSSAFVYNCLCVKASVSGETNGMPSCYPVLLCAACKELANWRKLIILCLLITGSVHTSYGATQKPPSDTPRKDTNSRYDQLKNQIGEQQLESTFKYCSEQLEKIRILEEKLAKEGRIVTASDRKTDPSLIRQRKSDPDVHLKENSNLAFEIATDDLAERFNLTEEDIAQHLPRLPLNGTLSRRNVEACLNASRIDNCNASYPYRTASGVCNNLDSPNWGMATTCQQRLLSANYIGTAGYRRSVTGEPLPAPRQLSRNMHYNFYNPTNYVTHMYMFYGQLLDHDITQTPVSTTVENNAIECCPPENETHPQCAPVLISPKDSFYSRFNVTCLNFVRSASCPTCVLGHRQQMNQVTSFIDASFMYGNSINDTANLRTNDGTGRMRVQQSSFGDLLPRSPDPESDQCSFPETNDICFEAGDSRANQHTVLTSLHTLFVREHNRIATALRSLNRRWDGERIFQETRRIIGAIIQAITYKEYLPITLGDDRMRYFGLYPAFRGSTVYDRRKNPTMISEFTSAAFRFGHSLINSVVARAPLNATNGVRLLRNEFFQPFDLYNGVMGPLLQGASTSEAQWFDRYLVPDVTDFLYRIRGDQTGLDLASFNINRGRDHGTPTYVQMVRFCSEGNIVVRDFRDLLRYNLMLSRQVIALENNYRSVQDVDLWPGILMEIPNQGAVVGPTAACIIGVQFNHLKYGDRFYFEHRNQIGSFTYQQSEELRISSSLSNIICLNSGVRQMPSNAMLFLSGNNPRIDCRNVRGVNLLYWRE